MMNQYVTSFVSTRSDSSGKLVFSGSYNVGNNFSLKSEDFFMDSDSQKSHLQYELMKEFKESNLSYKFGAGTQKIIMMSTLSSKFLEGSEMIDIVHYKKGISTMEITTITTFIHSTHNTFQWKEKRPCQQVTQTDPQED